MTGAAARRIARRATRAAIAATCLAVAACGGRVPSLPTGSGSPFPDAASAYSDATAQCRGVRTLSAELAMSGRAAGQRVRGRLLGGFAEPGQLRLEAPAPFGKSVFTLVAHDGTATLVLNREGRVVRDVPPADLVEALAGIALGPDDLRSAVAGCGLGVDQIASGQSYPGDWLAADGARGRIWLRRVAGAWRLVASARDTLELRYEEFVSGRPSVVRLRTTAAQDAATDLTLRLSQVDINVTLNADVFQVEIPEGATPLTLDELKRGGALGGGGAGQAADSREQP